jgi:hypothetical protein
VILDLSQNKRLYVKRGDRETPLDDWTRLEPGNVVFRIDNVNRYQYDIKITMQRQDLHTEVPQAFQSHLIPAAPTKGQRQPPAEAEAFDTALEAFHEQLRYLVKLTRLDNDLIDMASVPKHVTPDVVLRLAERASDGCKEILDAAGVAGERPLTLIDCKQPLLAKLTEKFRSLEDMYQKERDALLKTLPRDPSKISHQEWLAAADKLQPKLDALESRMKDAKDRYQRVLESDKAPNADQPSPLDLEIRASARVAEVFAEKVGFQAESAPLFVAGDVIKIAYEAKVRPGFNSDPGLSNFSDEFVLPVNGPVRINFSSGAFFTTLADRNFTTVTRGGQTVVVETGSDQLSVGLGGLGHFYKAGFGSFRGVQPALSVGAALTGNTAQYLGGISFLVGDEQRFVLTVGGVWAPVSRLDPGLSVDQPLPDNRASISSTHIDGPKLFVGLTYNLKRK